MTDWITASISRGFSHLVGLQILSRLLTFALNQLLLLRYLDPSVLGLVSVQLELFQASVLFLSREAIRCALLRANLVDGLLRGNKGAADEVDADVGRRRATTSGSVESEQDILLAGPGGGNSNEDRKRSVSRGRSSTRRRGRPRHSKDPEHEYESQASAEEDPRSPRSVHADRVEQIATSDLTVNLLHNFQAILNLAYLPILLALVLSMAGYYAYTCVAWWDRPWLHPAVRLYAVAVLVESLAEPLYILAQNLLFIQARVRIEATAVLVRCLLCFYWIVSSSTFSNDGNTTLQQSMESLASMAFGYAQLAYACTLLLGYLHFFYRVIHRNHKRHLSKHDEYWKSVDKLEHSRPSLSTDPSHSTSSSSSSRTSPASQEFHILDVVSRQRIVFLQSWTDLFPKALDGGSAFFGYFDRHLVSLALTFTGQSFVKYLLTEGDKLVLSMISNAYDQGIYVLVSNYGSLVVRILFFPMEESARALFSKLLTVNHLTSLALQQCARVISLVIKSNLYLGLVLAAFGTRYTSTFLQLLAGGKWMETDAPTALAAYCLLIPLLGINGITEGFVHSVANARQIHRMTLWMVLFFGIYAACAVYTIQSLGWGTSGLIFANAVNMLLRIGWSWTFLVDVFQQRSTSKGSRSVVDKQLSLHGLVPPISVLSVFVLSFMVLCAVQWQGHGDWFVNLGVFGRWQAMVEYVGLGTILFAVTALWTYPRDRGFFQELASLRSSKN